MRMAPHTYMCRRTHICAPCAWRRTHLCANKHTSRINISDNEYSTFVEFLTLFYQKKKMNADALSVFENTRIHLMN